MTDRTYGAATEQFAASSPVVGQVDTQAQAFSDLSRTLTEALEQARLQAAEIVDRAQAHSDAVVKGTERRLAEGLRQATAAERRAVVAQDRLNDLHGRIEQAQALLAQIGARADEIARLVTATEPSPTADETIILSPLAQHGNGASSATPANALNAPDLDPLAALALLHDAVDAAR